ncbi:hypothetical protein BC831DRAFT_43149 [Entophlyctis helioformis]|nr:hypothetical protein BC831DRAFT_43149 [Entophlyctis helioformis]
MVSTTCAKPHATMSNNSVNSHGGNNDNNNGSNQLPANAPLGQQQLQQQPLLQQQLQALPAGQALMAQLLQEALNRNERLAQQQQQERQEQQRQLFQLVETIQQLNAALNQKTTELAQRTTELAQKTAESAVLNERLQAEIAQKTAESTALNQKTAELAQKTTELAQKTAESAALQAETQRLENEINATKCMLAVLPCPAMCTCCCDALGTLTTGCYQAHLKSTSTGTSHMESATISLDIPGRCSQDLRLALRLDRGRTRRRAPPA